MLLLSARCIDALLCTAILLHFSDSSCRQGGKRAPMKKMSQVTVRISDTDKQHWI